MSGILAPFQIRKCWFGVVVKDFAVLGGTVQLYCLQTAFMCCTVVSASKTVQNHADNIMQIDNWLMGCALGQSCKASALG